MQRSRRRSWTLHVLTPLSHLLFATCTKLRSTSLSKYKSAIFSSSGEFDVPTFFSLNEPFNYPQLAQCSHRNFIIFRIHPPNENKNDTFLIYL
ncbi:hypothetical protein S83_049259 [Arachis hypogaea]